MDLPRDVDSASIVPVFFSVSCSRGAREKGASYSNRITKISASSRSSAYDMGDSELEIWE